MNAKTYSVRESEIERRWYVVDATDETLGRLASRIAHVLEGKHKPTYQPSLDSGDHVIVLNAGRISVTSDKLESKLYSRHSGRACRQAPGCDTPAHCAPPGNGLRRVCDGVCGRIPPSARRANLPVSASQRV